MSESITDNDSGLNSLSGFSFQIKVFIYQLVQISKVQRVEFETLDDVAVKSIPKTESITDSCTKYKVDDVAATLEIFQVKQTNVTNAVGQKVLYNWLLAYNKRRNISCFTLYVASGYSCNIENLRNDAIKEYKAIVNSNKSPVALVSQVKKCYEHNQEAFIQDYNEIFEKMNVCFLQDIEKLIAANLESVFHANAADVGENYFSKRVEELFTRICSRIMESALKRIPYICTHGEYMQLCEEICKSISNISYSPDYESFKRVFAENDLSAILANTREFRQLNYCGLDSSKVREHLRWGQYYQNIRHHFLADAKKEIIQKTENIAFQNHEDVVFELRAECKDKPSLRLIKTRDKPISTMCDEFSRWGTYIYLTKDNIDNQISWKDEDEVIDEE